MPYTAPTTLSEVYDDRHFREAFQSFAEDTQASENVRFHDEVLAYKAMAKNGASEQTLRAEARRIFEKYAPKATERQTLGQSPSVTPPNQGVDPFERPKPKMLDLNDVGGMDLGFTSAQRPSASMEINLTSPVHQNLVQNMRHLNSAGRDTLASVFDQSDAEVSHLLENDVLSRFKVSPEYQAINHRLSNAADSHIQAEKNQVARAQQIRSEEMALYGGDRELQHLVGSAKHMRLIVDADKDRLLKQAAIYRNKADDMQSHPTLGQRFRALFTPGGMQELAKREVDKAKQLEGKAQGMENDQLELEKEANEKLMKKQQELAQKSPSHDQGLHHSVRQDVEEEQLHSHHQGQEHALQNDHVKLPSDKGQHQGQGGTLHKHSKVGDIVHHQEQDKGKGESVHHGHGPQ